MTTDYQLRRDKQRIEAVQEATLTSWKFGIMRTHELFGSDEWRQKINFGKLRVHLLSGVIKQLYMGGMRDTPKFVVRSDEGDDSHWPRAANSEHLSRDYAVGSAVEINEKR